jgi:streptogramin lyase
MGWFLSSLKALGRRSWEPRRATKRNRSWIVEDLEGRRLLSHAVQSIVTLPNTTSLMIAGPGGDLWVAVHPTPSTIAIDRIGLDGSVTQYPVPDNAPNGGFSIGSLTTGPDGNVWFDAEYDSSPSDNQVVVGYVTPEGQVTEFPPIPVPAGQYAVADYDAMVGGPGGDLWFGYSVVNSAKQS